MPLNFTVVMFLFSVSYLDASYLFLGCAALGGLALAAHGALTKQLALDSLTASHSRLDEAKEEGESEHNVHSSPLPIIETKADTS